MRKQVCLISNLRALVSAHEAIMSPAQSGTRIAVVHGRAGLGKSTALEYMATDSGAARITAHPLWTPAWMLSDISEALGGAPAHSCRRMYEFISRALLARPRALLIDEADWIARRDVLVDTLRAIHDASDGPIVLAGMEMFRARAAHRPQLHRRISREVQFGAATMADAMMLARELCEVELAEDLVLRLHERAGGSVGLIVAGLRDVEAFARRHRMSRVDRAKYYGDEDSPHPRSLPGQGEGTEKRPLKAVG